MFGIDPRAARAAWTVFLVAFALGALYLARDTLFLLVLAVFFAYLVEPAVRFIEKRVPRLSRTVSVSIVFVAVLGLVGVTGTLIGQRVSSQATALSQSLPVLLKDPHATDRIPLPRFMEPLRARIVEAVRSQVQENKDQAAPLAQRIGRDVLLFAGNLIYIIIVPIVSFLLIKDAARLHDATLAMIDSAEWRALWRRILRELNTAFASYIRALLLLSIAVFCVYGLAFSALGVPYALVLAGVAAPLEFIPFAGPLAAAVIALLVAAFSGYDNLVWIAAFIAFYRVFQDYVLSPYLMSEGVEVHPVLVIVGLLAGEEIGGVAGMFLAVPLIAAAKVVLNARHPDRPQAGRAAESARQRGVDAAKPGD